MAATKLNKDEIAELLKKGMGVEEIVASDPAKFKRSSVYAVKKSLEESESVSDQRLKDEITVTKYLIRGAPLSDIVVKTWIGIDRVSEIYQKFEKMITLGQNHLKLIQDLDIKTIQQNAVDLMMRAADFLRLHGESKRKRCIYYNGSYCTLWVMVPDEKETRYALRRGQRYYVNVSKYPEYCAPCAEFRTSSRS